MASVKWQWSHLTACITTTTHPKPPTIKTPSTCTVLFRQQWRQAVTLPSVTHMFSTHQGHQPASHLTLLCFSMFILLLKMPFLNPSCSPLTLPVTNKSYVLRYYLQCYSTIILYPKVFSVRYSAFYSPSLLPASQQIFTEICVVSFYNFFFAWRSEFRNVLLEKVDLKETQN